jgi:chemotaxis protein MotB
MSDDAPKKSEAPAGSPAWVMTFADLMSLLMCFFVLLLSFSEMDVRKYKQLSGSMKNAFGVQREVVAHEIPRGTSIVKKEFAPGEPVRTIRQSVKQDSADTEQDKLIKPRGLKTDKGEKATEKDARRIANLLRDEIKKGQIEVETRNRKVVVRILEDGAFPSGTADINPAFLRSMEKIRKAVRQVNGKIKIGGHTDNMPIVTDKYRSNWELSAARAVSVAHSLMRLEQIPRSRFEIIGYADTKPLVSNDSAENRAKNRRVEIIIQQGDDLTVDRKDKVSQNSHSEAPKHRAQIIINSQAG